VPTSNEQGVMRNWQSAPKVYSEISEISEAYWIAKFGGGTNGTGQTGRTVISNFPVYTNFINIVSSAIAPEF
jgi:hypothetical protein